MSFDQLKWRRLLSPIGLALLIGFSVLLLLARPAQALDGTVTNCANDTQLTQLLGGGGSITFNCGGPTTIVLSSQKIITQPTSIDGGGVITLSGNGLTRTFYVQSGAVLSLTRITIFNGKVAGLNGGGVFNEGHLIISASTFISNSAGGSQGGAIYSSGPLTITSSSFNSNRAGQGGALTLESAEGLISNTTFISNFAGHAAAIELNQLDADSRAVSIVNSTFVSNTANTYAGAILDQHYGALTIRGSRFYQNRTLLGGSAALEVDSGDLLTPTSVLIADSLFYSNTSAKNEGVIVLAEATTSVLTNVKIYANQLLTATQPECAGAGVLSAGTLSIFNSEIFSNVITSGDGYGGGLCVSVGTTLLSNVQIYSNTVQSDGGGMYSAGSLSMLNTIVRDNRATGAGGGLSAQGMLTITGGTLSNNRANYGAAIETAAHTTWISGTAFLSNTATSSGAGINRGSTSGDPLPDTLTVINSLFISNTATNGWTAIANDTYGLVAITGSVFYKNHATNSGTSAVHIAGNGVSKTIASIANSQFYSNTAKLDIGAIELNFDTTSVLTNVQIYNNVVLGSNECAGAGLHSAGILEMYNSGVFGNVLSGTGSGAGICIRSGQVELTNVNVYNNQARQTAYCAGIDANESLTIMGGGIYSNSVASSNQAGGGLCVTAGTATLVDSSVHDNTAGGSGGIENYGILIMTGTQVYRNTARGQYAGGIGSFGLGLYLYDVDIYSNTVIGANGFGGGLDHESGLSNPANLKRVRIFGNTIISGTSGGAGAGIGIFESGSILTLTESSVFGNFVGGNGSGAGIAASQGTTVTVISSAVYNNAAPNGFGGGLNAGGSFGGAKIVLVNSTLANNSALGGGGLRNTFMAAPVIMTNVTVYGNSASIGGNISGTAKLINTIVGGSANNCAGSITSLGHNLDSGNTCGLNSTGDLTNTNPVLFALGNYGGPTPSLPPLAGSPAINHSTCALSIDQRGVARPVGGGCDIGAVEGAYQPPYSIYLPLALKNF